jgi:hypothetical protein
MHSSKADPVRRYVVRAEPVMGLTARVLEEFAKRDVLPDLFEARVSGGELDLRVDCRGLESDAAEHVALVLANFPGIRDVQLMAARLREAA